MNSKHESKKGIVRHNVPKENIKTGTIFRSCNINKNDQIQGLVLP